MKKAGYEKSPLETHEVESYQVVKANITSQTVECLKDFDLDSKSKARCKNFYALGMTYFLCSIESWSNRIMDSTKIWKETCFS